MKRTTLFTIATTILFVIVIVGALILLTAGARASITPSPSPSASPSVEPTSTPTPVPCPWPIVKRTRAARAATVIAWARGSEVRDCFDRPPRARPPRLPARAKPEATWRAALTRYRDLTAQYRAERKMLRHKMRNPGQPVNGERWRPLALWVGWTRAEWPIVLYIMAKRGGTGESGGWPSALNPSSKCGGLMQIHPMFYWGIWAIRGVKEAFNWRDPEVNLRKAEGIQDDSGWDPWAYP